MSRHSNRFWKALAKSTRIATEPTPTMGDEVAVGEGGGMSMTTSSLLSSLTVARTCEFFKINWFLSSSYPKQEIELLLMASKDLQMQMSISPSRSSSKC